MKLKSNDLIHKNTLSIYNGTISMCKLAAKDSLILIKGERRLLCGRSIQFQWSIQYSHTVTLTEN